MLLFIIVPSTELTQLTLSKHESIWSMSSNSPWLNRLLLFNYSLLSFSFSPYLCSQSYINFTMYTRFKLLKWPTFINQSPSLKFLIFLGGLIIKDNNQAQHALNNRKAFVSVFALHTVQYRLMGLFCYRSWIALLNRVVIMKMRLQKVKLLTESSWQKALLLRIHISSNTIESPAAYLSPIELSCRKTIKKWRGVREVVGWEVLSPCSKSDFSDLMF